MDKNFVVGFLSCACLFMLMALSQVNTNYDKKSSIFEEFYNIYMNFQPKQFKLFTSTPNLSQLQDREIVVYSSGSVTPVSNLIWRRNTQMYAVIGGTIAFNK